MTAFYSFNAIANYFGVHPSTVRKMVDRGELKTVRIGKRERIPACELRRYTEASVDAKNSNKENDHVNNDPIL